MLSVKKMTLTQLNDQVRELAYQGQDFLDIQRAMEQMEASAEDRVLVLKFLDDYIIDYQLFEQRRSKALTEMLVGGLIMVVALFIGFTPFMDAWLQKIVMFVMLYIGGRMVYKAFQQYKIPIQPIHNHEVKFKKGDLRKF